MVLPEKDNLDEEGNETLVDQDNSHESDDDDSENDDEQDAKSKRHKEQMEWSKKEVERIRSIAIETAVVAAKADARSLMKLHEADPKLANDVAKKFGYDNYKDAESAIEAEIKKNDKSSDDDDFESKYAKKKAEEEHQRALKLADKEFGKLDEEIGAKAQRYFERITKWQQLDLDSVEELIDMARHYAKKWKTSEDSERRAKESYHSMGVWSGWRAWADDDEPYVENGRLVYPSKKK